MGEDERLASKNFLLRRYENFPCTPWRVSSPKVLPLFTTVESWSEVPLPVPAANAEGTFNCPVTPPGINSGNDFPGFDNNTNIFVGGDFRVTESAAEAEVKMVVMGNANIDKAEQGIYNIGVVGVGSLVPPTPMSDMLLLEGSLGSNGTTIDGGSSIGGAVRMGGADDVPAGKLHTNGGLVTAADATAVRDYASLGTLLKQRSVEYAGQVVNGSAAVQPWGALELTGDGSSAVQTFMLDGGTLGSPTKAISLQFLGIPAGAKIVINVTGGPSAGLFLNTVLDASGVP